MRMLAIPEYSDRKKVGLRILVLHCPGRERVVLVVVEKRTVISSPAALCFNANVGDTGVLRREVFREDGQFADRFERRLTTRWLAEDSPVSPLTIEREAGAVALSTNELEAAVAIRALRDIRVQIEKLVDVSTVSRYTDQLLIVHGA